MPNWTLSVNKETPATANEAPIAEIHVLMYDLTPGGSQVQIKWPPSAQAGTSGAASAQAAMIATAMGEIKNAAELLGGEN